MSTDEQVPSIGNARATVAALRAVDEAAAKIERANQPLPPHLWKPRKLSIAVTMLMRNVMSRKL